MAEETDLSRTEPASPRRLAAARQRGDVPRSRDVSAWLVWTVALAAAAWLAPRWLAAAKALLVASFASAGAGTLRVPVAAVVDALLAVLPFLVIVFGAALVAPFLTGWVFAPAAFAFDWTRLDPTARIRRLFSAETLFDLARFAVKLAAAAAVSMWLLDALRATFTPAALSPARAFAMAADVVWRTFWVLAAVLAVFAVLDGAWRVWRHRRRHAMTWQEVLAEAREAEGSPEMRARLRERQAHAAQLLRQPDRGGT
jgi:flagellar biosynthetic protein FlhB